MSDTKLNELLEKYVVARIDSNQPFAMAYIIEKRDNAKQALINYIESLTQEAESRLKTWLAVREEELYYARLDATKHIRAAIERHGETLREFGMDIQTGIALHCAILKALKQADGEREK